MNELNDFISYEVNNILNECFGREYAKQISIMVIPEIKSLIGKSYKRNELKALLGKVLINFMKGEKL